MSHQGWSRSQLAEEPDHADYVGAKSDTETALLLRSIRHPLT
ncbi:hypothetical protein [Candidatus Poriferisodalis sp.]